MFTNNEQCTESVANEHPEGRHPEICTWILYNFCLLRGLLCLQNFNSFFLPFVSVMCISRNYPYPPPFKWQQKFRGDGGGGGSKKRQFQREWGVVTSEWVLWKQTSLSWLEEMLYAHVRKPFRCCDWLSEFFKWVFLWRKLWVHLSMYMINVLFVLLVFFN